MPPNMRRAFDNTVKMGLITLADQEPQSGVGGGGGRGANRPTSGTSIQQKKQQFVDELSRLATKHLAPDQYFTLLWLSRVELWLYEIMAVADINMGS